MGFDSELFEDKNDKKIIEPSYICALMPDGTFQDVKALNHLWEEGDVDGSFHQIFKTKKRFLQESQLGVCVGGLFVPISQMMIHEGKPRDIAKQTISMERKLKNIEKRL